jgi:glutaredoxin
VERVVLYTREGCHLCEDARVVVASVCEAAGAAWREVDVDADPALVEKYGEYVPVVEVDGVQQGFWRVDAARLARRLA